MTNVDTRLAGYHDRALRLETSKREVAEDLKELRKEMKGTGLSKTEVAGVFLAVKRSFESDDRKAARTAEEEVAAMLAREGLGLFAAAA